MPGDHRSLDSQSVSEGLAFALGPESDRQVWHDPLGSSSQLTGWDTDVAVVSPRRGTAVEGRARIDVFGSAVPS
jgi:hypothetical protein